MRNIFKFLLILPILFSACKEDKTMAFDEDSAYIQFNLPFKLDEYKRPLKVRVDSLIYSFALDDKSITKYTFKVPISVVGYGKSRDRGYKVIFEADSSVVKDADWDKSSIDKAVIRKGNIFDTLHVTVHRSAEIKKEYRSIVLRLLPNDNFVLGDHSLSIVKLSFSDILQSPKWWEKWQYYFGDFCKEKYVKWQEIYYLGADPNVQPYDIYENYGMQFYWDNMPPNTRDFPSTLMFIRILKQYFLDNEVYPDGDTSKPRITLPN